MGIVGMHGDHAAYFTESVTYQGLYNNDRPFQLHRVTKKTYSNGDPAISYFYDQTSYNGLTISNGIGPAGSPVEPSAGSGGQLQRHQPESGVQQPLAASDHSCLVHQPDDSSRP